MSSIEIDAQEFEEARRDPKTRKLIDDAIAYGKSLEARDHSVPQPERLGGEEGPGAAEMLAEFHALFSYEKTTDPALRLTLHEEEHKELVEAIESGDPEAIARELADVVYVAYGSAWSLGIDLDAAIREVHRANLSKLGDDGKPVYRGDGKVLKGPNFRPPDLRLALEGHPVVIDQERGGIFLADPAPEHSKGGLEDPRTERGVLRDAHVLGFVEGAMYAGHRYEPGSYPTDSEAVDRILRSAQRNRDLYPALAALADQVAPQPNQGSDQPKGDTDASAADQRLEVGPKDCGGSGVVEEFRHGMVGWPPCPGCNHPDCPNRDQGKENQ